MKGERRKINPTLMGRVEGGGGYVMVNAGTI